jgi:glycine/D-amino acid oxidase-like deaminating enzyme
MATVDVTVRGAGIFGLSVAYACARRGARVRVVDPNGVASGASGGIVGALAPHVPDPWNTKKQFQFESLVMARAFWAGIETSSGLDAGYAQTGRLQPLADQRAVAQARDRSDAANLVWQRRAAWTVVPVTEHPDWAPISPSGWLIHDTLSARIHPRKATLALAAAVAALGGEFVPDAADAGRVVWATGWTGLAEGLGNGVKGQAALLSLDARDRPQLFADAIHIVPHGDGTVAVGSTSEREWDAPATTDALLDDVLARALAAFPVLQGARVIERWAGVRPRAVSRAPLLGVHPRHPGQFIANGGFKIGFGIAPLVGEVMADLVLDEVDRIPDGFRAPPESIRGPIAQENLTP